MRKLFLILMTLMACTWGLQAQTRTYHGTVVDAANNEPLIGATVLPIGGGQGTATDIDGNFTLSVPASVKSIKVSYVGYKEQTVPLTEGVKVHLTSTASNLDDVVVVAYGTANKESLTGSVAVVGAKEIEDRPVTSVTAALEGNAPGVQVNNSTGTPGSAPSIRIRGFNSFTSAQSPLYVVDGIVYEGDPSDINPADIESMSVLKDAASSALYGNRGANGVILINTKRAKNVGKIDVTLQVRQGMYNRGLPYYDTLGVGDWMETALRSWAHGEYTSGAFSSFDEAIKSSAPDMVSTLLKDTNIFDKKADEVFDENGNLVAGVLPGYTDLDWWDVISQTGYRQEYNINATGATEKFNVFASVGYLKENGYMLKTDFERFNGRVVANFEPVSYFRMGTNISASYVDSDTGIANSDELGAISNPFQVNGYAPVIPYYQHNEDGSIMYDDNGSPIWNTGGLNKGSNIAWNMRLDDNNYTSLNVNAMLYGTAVLPYGFEATVRGSITRNKQNGMSYMNNTIGSSMGIGSIDYSSYDLKSHTFMQTLTWDHQYGDHHIDVLLDHENYEVYAYQANIRKSGQMFPGMINLSNFEENDNVYDSNTRRRTESYLGRARYNYDQKYFGEFSVRRDGTSRFSKDNRWGTFWSVGGSWVISKEKFMHNLSWLDFLKLRAAYGSVGNDAAASAYSAWSLYSILTYDKVGSLLPVQLGAVDLKWEATKTFDIALEGNLFNDRFNFSIGYFNKENSDLLYNRMLPGSVGILGRGGMPSVMENICTLRNTGWELMFGVDIIRNQNFVWDFHVDATFLKNKIVKLPDNQDIVGQGLFKGKSIYEHYTYEWAGVDQLTGNSLYAMNPDSPDFYYYDEQGAFVFDEKMYNTRLEEAEKSGHLFDINGVKYTDRVQYAGKKLMGSSIPTVYGSIGTSFSWKGVNLAILMTYSLGGKTSNGVYGSLMQLRKDSPGALHKDILKSWTSAPEGMTEDSPNRIDPNGVPVLDSSLAEFNNQGSRFLVSNNYLCMKNINLSYDFPKAWSNALKLSNINLGASVDNLFIITRQKGLNPQYGFGGEQGNFYVPSRVFSFQLAVKF